VRYLVDTDWVIDFLENRTPAVDLIGRLLPDGAGISIINYMEAVEGIRGSGRPSAARDVFHRFLEAVPIIGLSIAIVERAADIRLHLRQQKLSVNHRALDILIAATAIEHRLMLVTRNVRHYADIPGILLHDR
jgi:tRNA(fMet)-specific endonuclease VapC